MIRHLPIALLPALALAIGPTRVRAESQRPWALAPLVAPPVPAAPPALRAWVKNPIDNFVAEGLKGQGLRPAPAAGRTTMLRRLHLDLVGLPPNPEEVARFVADNRPDAYARVVEALLSSAHHGEHWGRAWLDAARYADTNGFEKDRPRSIWPYRDWVIAAFNDDMPLDRFVTEQLAGDLLPGAGWRQRVATGFLRNSMENEEGGVDVEQFRVESVIDRVDALSKAFLGLTVACAQCHDHKYDPISQEDYYRLFAYLDSDEDAIMEVPDEALLRKRAEIEQEVVALEQNVLASHRILQERMQAWEARLDRARARYRPLEDSQIFGAFGQKFERLEDGSYLARGDIHLEATYKVSGRSARPVTGIRLEMLTHPSLFHGGPGRNEEGTLVLTELQVTAGPDKPGAVLRPVPLARADASVEVARAEAATSIDGDNQTGWSSNLGPGRRNRDFELVFTPAHPISFAGGTRFELTLMQRAGGRKTIGRFRVSVTSDERPLEADPLTPELRRILAQPRARRSAAEQAKLLHAFLQDQSGDEVVQRLNDKTAKLLDKWPYGPTTLVLQARTPARKTHVFHRGDFRKPLAAVTAGVPPALHALPTGARGDRLGLATWLASRDNPLTARVLVNRIWQRYFGTGLVDTPEDFGARAAAPSHPALLDWLAVKFLESGGRWKPLHRLIVGSATYQQASAVHERSRDPHNRLLSRGPRFRVEAETIRDIALSAAGLLDRTIGGAGVYPPLPAGAQGLTFAEKPWPTTMGPAQHRRGLYVHWKRALPYPGLVVFDAPTAESSCVRRERSNTPLQALTTLNDPVFVAAAQAMALRVWRSTNGDEERLRHAFALATGRSPTDRETSRMRTFVRAQRVHFAGNTARAVLVTAADPTAPPEGIDLHRLAPFTLLCRALLNLDETISKE